jgi:hypothetical protein
VLLIAIWAFLSAIFNFIAILAVLVFAVPEALFRGPPTAGDIFGMSVGTLYLIAGLALGVAGGIGLLQGKEWGRVVTIMKAALSLFVIPIGTIIGILVLVYLFRPEVREYFQGSD